MASSRQTKALYDINDPRVVALRKAGSDDLDAFVQANMHIIGKDSQDHLLKYRYGQRKLAALWRQHERENRPTRIFDLKSRQIGQTTMVKNRNSAKAICRDNISVVTVAHVEKRAIEILQKTKYARSKLDPLLQLALSKDAGEGLMYADTFSRELIISAQNIEAVRSSTHSDIHLSEWPLYPDPELALYEVSQVCHRLPGTSIIIEGTGKRQGSFAHQFWRRCKRGEEAYTAQFLPWQEDPECSVLFLNDKDRDTKLAEAFAYEPALKERARIYNLSPGHLYWGYLQLKYESLGNWEKFLEDYPCDDEECWRSKGDIYFGAHNVTRLMDQVKEVDYEPFYLDLEHLERGFTNPFSDLPRPAKFDPVSTSHPHLIIYAMPKPGHSYVVSGDSGGGSTGGDPSSTFVIDMHTGEMMAEFHGVVQPHQHARVMASFGFWYNNAIAVPECNGLGMSTLNELYRCYNRFYQWRPFDDSRFRVSNKDGWWTGPKSRNMMLALVLRVVEEVAKGNPSASGMIRSHGLIDEMRTFLEDEMSGIPYAAPGCHDDRIIAWAIAWIVSQQETRGMNEDILHRLAATGEPAADTRHLTGLQKLDVPDAISKIKQVLGIEDQQNAIPISENWSIF